MSDKIPDSAQARAEMVAHQLANRDITDPRVLEAMGKIPRHCFVSDDLLASAYKDRPLPIGFGQTISQPYIVAFMTQALALPSAAQLTVLEVGTGSGYFAACLGALARSVKSIEIHPELAASARANLARTDVHNVVVEAADAFAIDGTARYDAVVLT